MTDTPKEQLIDARRNQILDAATRVIAAKGFHPATIRDIAREAGLADGTIYNYFENKTALLLAILERLRKAAAGSLDLEAVSTAEPGSFLSAFLRAPLSALRTDNFEILRIVISEALVNPKMAELYYKQIIVPTLEMAEGPLRAWASANNLQIHEDGLTARLIVSLMLGLAIQAALGDRLLAERWDDLPDSAASLLLAGLPGMEPSK